MDFGRSEEATIFARYSAVPRDNAVEQGKTKEE